MMRACEVILQELQKNRQPNNGEFQFDEALCLNADEA